MRFGAIDVVNAVITAQGHNMTTSIQETENAAATATAEQPKAAKKARVGARRAKGASSKPKSGKKATPAKKAPKSAKKATGARDGSKAARILDLLKRPGGATAKELQKASGWQAHSVRGFLSGTVGKKMGLTVVSTKGEDGGRTYSAKA
jgi:sugar/nucleoside kinase (ribokinase family)